ncbi:MAG: hypothetical protein QHH13_02910 [Melioribacter sp.]|uniref:hypothetical protein n=1 Tax=Rosettibacter primus TaxID=3111523 RepID=UPI00247ED7D9|nr:hypothetical protein [Melioribacter sp.]
MKKYNFIFIDLLILFSVLILSIHFFNQTPIRIFTISYILSSAVFILISFFVLKYNLNKNIIIISVLIGIIIRISFINTMPIGSDDIYRYMWDGKVQSNGINPYKFSPADSNLIFLHSDILPAKVNFPELKTIYFPLSQWLFFLGYQLSGENIWGYKLILMIFELLTIIILHLILRKLNMPSNYLLLYVLCPLPIFQFALDSHLDGYGLLLITMSILFYLMRRLAISMIFLGLSLSIKPIGILFIPVFFLEEHKISDKLKILFLPFVTFFIQFIPYIFSSNPFEALFVYAKHWSFNGGIFTLLNSFIKHNQITRIVCGIVLLIVLIPLYLSKYDLLKKIYYSVLMLLIFSPVVHPWYIGWLTVLMPVVPAYSGIMYSSLSSLTSFTVLSYQLNSVWKEYPLVLLLEYIPVILLMLFELNIIKKFYIARN